MSRECDVLVIGAGPGGYVAAIRAAQIGQKTIMVEKGRLGGECLNWGCIPSKALIHAGNVIHSIGKAADWGLTVQGFSLDMKKLQEWKQSVVDKLTSGVGQLCRGNGVDILPGSATFVSETEVEVTGITGAERITFRHCIIATGGRPTDLSAFKFDGKRIISSKEALEIPVVPQSLVIVGGGVTGLELGTFFAKLGTKVTVIELLEQVLPGTDPEAVRVVVRKLKKLGIAVHTSSTVKSWREQGDKVIVSADTPEGPIEATGDYVLLTVGRKANTEGLGLDKTKVALDRKGQIIVDKQLMTNVPSILAIGDATGPPFLAHRAMKQGIVAAEVAAGRKREADFKAMPAAIFTDPEVAVVGMSEADAAAKGLKVVIGKVPWGAIGRALTAGETDGFVKLIADEKTKLLLGAVIVGPSASDLISEVALAIEMGATIEDLALTVHPHPTFPEGLMETAERALGSAIHVLNK